MFQKINNMIRRPSWVNWRYLCLIALAVSATLYQPTSAMAGPVLVDSYANTYLNINNQGIKTYSTYFEIDLSGDSATNASINQIKIYTNVNASEIRYGVSGYYSNYTNPSYDQATPGSGWYYQYDPMGGGPLGMGQWYNNGFQYSQSVQWAIRDGSDANHTHYLLLSANSIGDNIKIAYSEALTWEPDEPWNEFTSWHGTTYSSNGSGSIYFSMNSNADTVRAIFSDGNGNDFEKLIAGPAIFPSDPQPVPIPGAIWLLGTGLIGLIGLKRKYLG